MMTGDPATGDATLRFSALSGVSAMIETVPLGFSGATAAHVTGNNRAKTQRFRQFSWSISRLSKGQKSQRRRRDKRADTDPLLK